MATKRLRWLESGSTEPDPTNRSTNGRSVIEPVPIQTTNPRLNEHEQTINILHSENLAREKQSRSTQLDCGAERSNPTESDQAMKYPVQLTANLKGPDKRKSVAIDDPEPSILEKSVAESCL
jgi:hypothetical protein